MMLYTDEQTYQGLMANAYNIPHINLSSYYAYHYITITLNEWPTLYIFSVICFSDYSHHNTYNNSYFDGSGKDDFYNEKAKC